MRPVALGVEVVRQVRERRGQGVRVVVAVTPRALLTSTREVVEVKVRQVVLVVLTLEMEAREQRRLYQALLSRMQVVEEEV